MRDLYLIFHGRGNKFIADQKLLRNATAIISDVTNQTMGGKGAREAVFQMWPLPGDKDENGGRDMTREERRALIKRHHEILEAKKKQDGRNEDTDRG